MKAATAMRPGESKESSFEELKQRIHSKLVDKLDLTRVSELEGDVLRREIRIVIEHLCDVEDTLLNRSERERLIDEVLDETFGLSHTARPPRPGKRIGSDAIGDVPGLDLFFG